MTKISIDDKTQKEPISFSTTPFVSPEGPQERKFADLERDGVSVGLPVNMIPRLQRESTCGISMRAGALIIAWLSVAGGLVIAIPPIIYGTDFIEFISNSSRQKEVLFRNEKFMDNVLIDGQSDSLDGMSIQNSNNEMATSVVSAVLDVLIAIGGFQLFISVLLVLGILKEIRCCMLPWLICQAIVCGFSMLLLLLFAVVPPALIMVPGSTYFSVPLLGIYIYFIQLSSSAVSAFVSVFMFYVVYSHYKNMKKQTYGFTSYEKM